MLACVDPNKTPLDDAFVPNKGAAVEFPDVVFKGVCEVVAEGFDPKIFEKALAELNIPLLL